MKIYDRPVGAPRRDHNRKLLRKLMAWRGVRTVPDQVDALTALEAATCLTMVAMRAGQRDVGTKRVIMAAVDKLLDLVQQQDTPAAAG